MPDGQEPQAEVKVASQQMMQVCADLERSCEKDDYENALRQIRFLHENAQYTRVADIAGNVWLLDIINARIAQIVGSHPEFFIRLARSQYEPMRSRDEYKAMAYMKDFLTKYFALAEKLAVTSRELARVVNTLKRQFGFEQEAVIGRLAAQYPIFALPEVREALIEMYRIFQLIRAAPDRTKENFLKGQFRTAENKLRDRLSDVIQRVYQRGEIGKIRGYHGKLVDLLNARLARPEGQPGRPMFPQIPDMRKPRPSMRLKQKRLE